MAAKYNSKKNKKPRLTKGRSLSMSPKNVGLHRRQCRNKHPLKKNTNMRIETCADCRAKVAKNGIMHSCKSCRFHVCKVCYSKPSCNNGHALTSTRASKNGIICGNNQCNYRARRGLTMKHCRLCKYYLCLGCFGCETCPGNHGLRLSRPSKVKQSLNDNNSNNTEMKTASNHNNNSNNNKKHSNNNNNEAITCGKCRRVFDKPNIPLFLCHECRYYLCGDCYQPSILFHRKRKEKLQKQHKKQQQNKINIIAPQAKVDANGNSIPPDINNNTSLNGSSYAPSAASAPSVASSTTNIIIDDHDEKIQASMNNNMLADNYYWGTDDETLTLTSGGGSGSGNNKNLKATGGHSGSKSDTCLDELNDLSTEPKELTRIPSIATECIICMETDKKMAFQPCGHYVACENCAMLMKLEGNCPICSAKILGLFRIFE